MAAPQFPWTLIRPSSQSQYARQYPNHSREYQHYMPWSANAIYGDSHDCHKTTSPSVYTYPSQLQKFLASYAPSCYAYDSTTSSGYYSRDSGISSYGCLPNYEYTSPQNVPQSTTETNIGQIPIDTCLISTSRVPTQGFEFTNSYEQTAQGAVSNTASMKSIPSMTQDVDDRRFHASTPKPVATEYDQVVRSCMDKIMDEMPMSPIAETSKDCTTTVDDTGCGKSAIATATPPFAHSQEVNAPKPNILPRDRSLACEFCHKVTRSLRGLHLHKRSCGPNTKRFCPICRKNFRSSRAYHVHKLLHRDDMVVKPKCQICDKIVANPVELSKHMYRHASVKKLFCCPYCIKSYAFVRDLKKHVRNTHATTLTYSN